MAVSGAAVLTTTGALVSDPGRRIAGTGLMLLDVMGFGEDADPPLAPGTRGFEAVRRVRLFHAVPRRIVLSTEVGWEERKLGERNSESANMASPSTRRISARRADLPVKPRFQDNSARPLGKMRSPLGERRYGIAIAI